MEAHHNSQKFYSEGNWVPPLVFARSALLGSATRAEFVISGLRAVFCLMVALRFVWIHSTQAVPNTAERGGVMLPATLLGFGFSVWMLARTRTGRIGPRLLAASTVCDPVVCTLALASNVFWPWPEYRGILSLPESVTFVALALTSGFRGSARLALIGAGTSGAGALILTLLDQRLNPSHLQHSGNSGSIYIILFLTTTALSTIGAHRTATLVRQASRYGYQSSRARDRLVHLLRENHDAASIVSSALFAIDRVAATPGDPSLIRILNADLQRLKLVIETVRDQAFTESSALDRLEQIELRSALSLELEARPPAVMQMPIHWLPPAQELYVELPGGRRTLRRMLLNLLLNAQQGDGLEGASQCEVVLNRNGRNVEIEVRDNGPGFADTDDLRSTKATGTGTGLAFVRSVVEASNGELRLSNTERGASVRLVFPRIEASAVRWRNATETRWMAERNEPATTRGP